MRVERGIFIFLTGFFTFITPVYWYLAREITGTWVMGLTAVLCAMVAAYIWIESRKIDPRPEDDPDGEIYQGAGELGFFPPTSIWPFWCALTITIIGMGPIFGWWIAIIGVGMGIWAASGWAYEFYRGDYAQ